MTRLKKVAGVRNLYIDKNGLFYVRSQKAAGNSFVSLGTTRKEKAITHMEALRNAVFCQQHGIDNGSSEKASPAIGWILTKYRERGYPDLKQRPRDKDSRYYRAQEDYFSLLHQFFGQKLVNELRPALLIEYHSWRKAQIRQKDAETQSMPDEEQAESPWRKGNRTVDLELTCLSNALTWAALQDVIPENPIKSRPRFTSSKDVRHSKDLAAEDMNDLHRICIPLFKNRRCETLGWQALFEAMTGVRTSEAISMRFDAKTGQPGAISSDGGFLYVRRAKKTEFVNPMVLIHDGLREWLEAHKAWHAVRYPNSPWFFPGLRGGGAEPVSPQALTHSFKALFESGNLDRRFSSHGMRATYVRIRRSQGASDSQIALELNQHGGVGTLIRCYGAVPPSWLNGKAPNLPWVATVKRGWEYIKPSSEAALAPAGVPETAGPERDSELDRKD